jgi:peptidoglycan/xylan/chitin deacetylase (PgdA/CDA1 family)
MALSTSSSSGGVVHHVTTGSKVYAPTFDCCATCAKKFGVATSLINDLKTQKVPATFFLTTEWMKAHKADAEKIIASKHFAVGLHGATHTSLPDISSNKKLLDNEISGAKQFYEATLKDMHQRGVLSPALYHQRMNEKLFRFPFGTFDSVSVKAVIDAGMKPIQWNGTADGNITLPQMHKEQSYQGSILLAHANESNAATRQTTQNFMQLHKHMTAKGYEAVTVPTLLTKGTIAYTNQPVPENTGLKRAIQNAYADNQRHNFGLTTRAAQTYKPTANA